jgi:hypothetical protein
MPESYPTTNLPPPHRDFFTFQAGDAVTFTSVREDPEKSRRGAEIREGFIVLRHAWQEVFIVESALPGHRRADARQSRAQPKEWALSRVRVRTVQRLVDGERLLVAKLPHILGTDAPPKQIAKRGRS